MEGPPLYAWAEQHAPSEEQVCRVVAQLARALEAVHAAARLEDLAVPPSNRLEKLREETFALISSSRTLGCFQIESPGQRELVAKLEPRSQQLQIIPTGYDHGKTHGFRIYLSPLIHHFGTTICLIQEACRPKKDHWDGVHSHLL